MDNYIHQVHNNIQMLITGQMEQGDPSQPSTSAPKERKKSQREIFDLKENIKQSIKGKRKMKKK